MENDDFFSIPELEDACIEGKKVGQTSRLAPALALAVRRGLKDGMNIAGTYGLLYVLQKDISVTPIAQLGFDIDGAGMVITNSPQGYTDDRLVGYSEEVKRAALQTLKGEKFRDTMLQEALNLAKRLKRLGVEVVVGISADNHPNVDINGGTIPYNHAKKIMDEVYLRNGFAEDFTGDYSFELY